MADMQRTTFTEVKRAFIHNDEGAQARVVSDSADDYLRAMLVCIFDAIEVSRRDMLDG